MEKNIKDAIKNGETLYVFGQNTASNASRMKVLRELQNGSIPVELYIEESVILAKRVGEEAPIASIIFKDGDSISFANFEQLAKKEPATNTLITGEDLLEIYNPGDVITATAISVPNVSVIKFSLEVDASHAKKKNKKKVVEPVVEAIDLSGFDEKDKPKVQARLDYIRTLNFGNATIANNVCKMTVEYLSSHTDIQDLKVSFINNGNIVEDAVSSYLIGDNLELVGPKGVGKNKLIAFLANFFDMPYLDFQGSSAGSKEEIIGSNNIDDNGKIIMQISNILEIAQTGGIITIDEANMLKGEITALFHSLLDDRGYIDVEKYGRVTVHPQTRFVITLNEGDGYEGTRPLNEAFEDRFHVIVFEPNPNCMKDILMLETGMDEKAAEQLAKYYSLIYNAVYNGTEDSTIPEKFLSQRAFIRAGKFYMHGLATSVEDAFRKKVLTKQDKEVRACIEQLISFCGV